MGYNLVMNCADGTDRNCFGKVEVEIGLKGLTSEQRQEIQADLDRFDSVKANANESSCEIELELTARQCEENGIELDEEDRQALVRKGSWSTYLTVNRATCGACGSDQTYDEDGNNISSH